MGAVVPNWVKKKAQAHDDLYGSTIRRFVDITLEVSGASADTVALATYVPGLTGVVAIMGSSELPASYATVSGTTMTLKQNGTAVTCLRGYY